MTAEQLAALVAFIRAEIAVEDLCVEFGLGCENGVPVERQEPEPLEDLRAPYAAIQHPRVYGYYAVYSSTEGYLLNYRKVPDRTLAQPHRTRMAAEIRLFAGHASAESAAHEQNRKKGIPV